VQGELAFVVPRTRRSRSVDVGADALETESGVRLLRAHAEPPLPTRSVLQAGALADNESARGAPATEGGAQGVESP
jgi:hypothetical protein